jgi:hypothetical protein
VIPRRSVHIDEKAGWHLAVRVAVASSLIVVAIAYALKRFADVPSIAIVVLTVAIGLAIGLSLPAARLPIPRWLDDPELWEEKDDAFEDDDASA